MYRRRRQLFGNIAFCSVSDTQEVQETDGSARFRRHMNRFNPSVKKTCDKKDDKKLRRHNRTATNSHLILKSAICSPFDRLPKAVTIASQLWCSQSYDITNSVNFFTEFDPFCRMKKASMRQKSGFKNIAVITPVWTSPKTLEHTTQTGFFLVQIARTPRNVAHCIHQQQCCCAKC